MCFLLMVISVGCSKDDDEEKKNNDTNTVTNGTYIQGMGYIVDGSFYGIDTLGNVGYLYPSPGTITSVTIPEQVTLMGKTYTVTQIKDFAFSGLKQLTTVKLPNTITYLGNSAFSGCNNLASVNLPDGLKDIKIYTFQYCKALTSITLPQGLTSISNYAFNGCENLASISFPATLRTIGLEAFRDCHNLKSVTCLAPTPPFFEISGSYPIFDSQTQESCTLYVPSELVETYKSAEGWKKFKNIIGI